jgi:hypothetical protein
VGSAINGAEKNEPCHLDAAGVHDPVVLAPGTSRTPENAGEIAVVQSRQIRAVYAELRRHAGKLVSDREVLVCAASLVELFSDVDEGPVFDLRAGGQSIGQWALDVAFADGGWRVMGYETALEEAIEAEEEKERWLHCGLARYHLEMTE